MTSETQKHVGKNKIMRKPFKYTVLGKVLIKSIVPALAEGANFIPVVGPIISNILSTTKGDGKSEVLSSPGSLDLTKAKLQLYGLMLIGGLASALALSMGWLTLDQIKNIVYLFADVV